MKRIIPLFAAVIAILSGCSKNIGSTYSFIDEYGVLQQLSSSDAMKDASITMTVVINEYQGSLCVRTNSVNNPQKDKRYSFTAQDGSEYLTVRYNIKASSKTNPSAPATEINKWFKTAYILTPGKDTEIKLTSSTVTTSTEPKK